MKLIPESEYSQDSSPRRKVLVATPVVKAFLGYELFSRPQSVFFSHERTALGSVGKAIATEIVTSVLQIIAPDPMTCARSCAPRKENFGQLRTT